MKTLDQLAKEVKALSIEISKLDIILVDTEDRRFVKCLAQGKLVNAAFCLIEKVPSIQGQRKKVNPGWTEAKIAWCKQAGIDAATAHFHRRVFTSSDPKARYLLERTRRLAKARDRYAITVPEGSIFAGGFGIMVRAMKHQTPKIFMNYPSVRKEDVYALLIFLEEALET